MSPPIEEYHAEPLDIEQLAQTARKTLAWNGDLPLEHHLRDARCFRDDGLKAVEAGDLEEAFVNLKKAEILLVDKIPTHREYVLRRTAAIKSDGVIVLNHLARVERTIKSSHHRSPLVMYRGDSAEPSESLRLTHPLQSNNADLAHEPPSFTLPALFTTSSLTAPIATLASLKLDISNIESSTYNPALKIAWAHEVMAFVNTTSHVLSLQDPPLGVVFINDLELRRTADLAISTILEIAAPNIEPVPLHVAQAIYLRGQFSMTGAYPDYVRYDPQAASRDFERAAEAGYIAGWFRLGRYHEKINNVLYARSCFEKGLQLGARRCIYRMGIAHALGQLGLQPDISRGLHLLHGAASLAKVGMAGPAYVFALILLGKFTPFPALSPATLAPFIPARSTAILEARKHMERAAYLGSAPAQYALGVAYEQASPPFSFDAILSVKYLTLASEQDQLEAHVALSKWFFYGAEGAFDKDEHLAFVFAQKAARKGFPTAELILGFYWETSVGCKRSIDNARWWYERAQANIDQKVANEAANLLSRLSEAESMQEGLDIRFSLPASSFSSSGSILDHSQTFEPVLEQEWSRNGDRSQDPDSDLETLKHVSISDSTKHESLEGQPEYLKGVVVRLTEVFNDILRYKKLLRVRDAPAQLLLDAFQMLLDSNNLDADFRRNLVVATQRLARSASLYPTSYNLENIELDSIHPVAAGGFADIYKGSLSGQHVCLKAIRLYQTSDVDSFLKQFSAEAVLWSQLSHPNLLPIYGLYQYNGRPCLISPWMVYGDLNKYLLKRPEANRNLLMLDISSGVAYLHDNDVIHGDLKGVNILVDSLGRACLADFGLSAVSDAGILHWTSHSSAASKGGSARWQAPELFDEETDEVVHNSKASDIYAVTCVAYEVFAGNLPFFEHARDTVIMVRVKAGAKPSRPPVSNPAWASWGLTEATWSIMEAGWSRDPADRPTVHEFVAHFRAQAPVDDRPIPKPGCTSSTRFRGSSAKLPPIDDIESLLDSIN